MSNEEDWALSGGKYNREIFVSDDKLLEYGITTLDTSNFIGDIRFIIDDETIMVIDKEGLIYKGERVEDAGEVYEIVTEMFKRMGY